MSGADTGPTFLKGPNMKTQKLYFTKDGFIDGVLVFAKGQTHEVPLASVERWIKRGATLEPLEDEETTPVEPTPVEPTPETEEEETLEEVEETLEEEEEELPKAGNKNNKRNKNK